MYILSKKISMEEEMFEIELTRCRLRASTSLQYFKQNSQM